MFVKTANRGYTGELFIFQKCVILRASIGVVAAFGKSFLYEKVLSLTYQVDTKQGAKNGNKTI